MGLSILIFNTIFKNMQIIFWEKKWNAFYWPRTSDSLQFEIDCHTTHFAKSLMSHDFLNTVQQSINLFWKYAGFNIVENAVCDWFCWQKREEHTEIFIFTAKKLIL